MFKQLFLLIIITLFLALPIKATSLWEIKSLDTMKFSRDLAREKALDSAFEKTIEMQAGKAKEIGTTHLAIGTPYDDEFIPFLTKWVSVARKNNLKVWFRGNFSGWEGWFGYSKITADKHLEKLNIFISNNSFLFEDGDIFTSCTECENGVLGDPRFNGNLDGYRRFLISEYQTAQKAFKNIGKNVTSNYFSMNADVARLVMDKETSQKLGCLIVIDHYVKSPEKLNSDVTEISQLSGCPVVLGEFGAPIPDIHGWMNEKSQEKWISDSLKLISTNPNLIGINYWVGFGGTTSIWEVNGTPRLAVQVIQSYFDPKTINLKITGWLNLPLKNVQIEANGRTYKTDRKGLVSIPYPPSLEKIKISKKSYSNLELMTNNLFPKGSDPEGSKEVGPLVFKLHREKFSLTKFLNSLF